MAQLNNDNCSIQKDSGAVIFHKSPELTETIKLRQDINELSKKIDTLLKCLQKEGDEN